MGWRIKAPFLSSWEQDLAAAPLYAPCIAKSERQAPTRGWCLQLDTHYLVESLKSHC